MSNLINLIGRLFGRLEVVEYAGRTRRKPSWICRCACGKRTTVRGDMLKSGNTRSCGCLLIDAVTKHGHSHSRPNKPPSKTYVTWQSMVARCTYPASDGYAHYGAAGISVCSRWTEFDNFLADMGERPAGLTLDRIDPAGNYEPDNCRWATPRRQARNRKNTRYLTHDGVTLSLSDWADKTNVPHSVLADRWRLGWPAERILSTPYVPRSPK